ncbi:hypothetical protein OAQ99_04545 [Candidatus Kapabacteria bacterium]|nr:hypothetical protein [Candidatus Kapabacteria bacterium]
MYYITDTQNETMISFKNDYKLFLDTIRKENTSKSLIEEMKLLIENVLSVIPDRILASEYENTSIGWENDRQISPLIHQKVDVVGNPTNSRYFASSYKGTSEEFINYIYNCIEDFKQKYAALYEEESDIEKKLITILEKLKNEHWIEKDYKITNGDLQYITVTFKEKIMIESKSKLLPKYVVAIFFFYFKLLTGNKAKIKFRYGGDDLEEEKLNQSFKKQYQFSPNQENLKSYRSMLKDKLKKTKTTKINSIILSSLN